VLEVRVEERVKSQWTTDPTAAMFNANKIMEEEKVKTKPQFYTRRGSAARREIQAWERGRRVESPKWSSGNEHSHGS